MTNEEMVKIINNKFENEGILLFEDIAKSFNIELKTFRKKIKESGLYENFPDVTKQMIKTIKNFDFLNEETAYWIGYILADGCITNTRLMLECKIDDIEILEKFCNFLNIRKSRISLGHSGKSCCLGLSKSKFSTFVDKYGIEKRKSFQENHVCKEIAKDKKLFFQYLKGYFDGDGTVHTAKNSQGISIVGDYTLLSEFKDCLEKYIENPISIWLNENFKKSDTHQLYTLKIGLGGKERRMVREIFNNFYSNNKIILTRKFNNFKSIL